MTAPLLNDVLVLATTDNLKIQKPDGSFGSEPWLPMIMDTWSICYANKLENNPHYRNPAVLAAIIRAGDYNERMFSPETGFLDNITGWDEWRMFSWLEAVERIADEIDPAKLERWRNIFVRHGEHVLENCIDMSHFDGAIPNHGIWNHAIFYRIGRLYNRPDFVEMAELAFDRVFKAQTPDGCFREGGTVAGFPGSPVVMYNLVSLMAINMYFGHSGDPAAEQALEKGFRWWWNTRFPDFTGIAAFDCRNAQEHSALKPGATHPKAHVLPAYFFNKPEARGLAEEVWKTRRPEPFTDERKSPNTGPYHSQAIGFIALQWDKILPSVVPEKREWPELTRFSALEAGVRRRNGWHVALSGINNTGASSTILPTWRLERQSLLAVWNEKCGLIAGSGNSLIQEQASSMTFYENGAAHYLHTDAYLKTTPLLDTLHLRYGGNTGAISVDTSTRERCEITFSMLGEKGKRSERGVGHPISAMAARGRLPLALKSGQSIRLNGQEWILNPKNGLCLRVNAGEKLECGEWSIACETTWWDFFWPVNLSNPYKPLNPGETIAVAELTLWTKSTTEKPQPTAAFTITI